MYSVRIECWWSVALPNSFCPFAMCQNFTFVLRIEGHSDTFASCPGKLIKSDTLCWI